MNINSLFLFNFRPDLFDYNERLSKLPKDNLEHAFTVAEKNVGVPKLLEPSGETFFDDAILILLSTSSQLCRLYVLSVTVNTHYKLMYSSHCQEHVLLS